LRTRTALRDPREDGEEDADERVARGADDPAGRRDGGGGGWRQIGQFSTKRLWRQKLGGTPLSLGAYWVSHAGVMTRAPSLGGGEVALVLRGECQLRHTEPMDVEQRATIARNSTSAAGGSPPALTDRRRRRLERESALRRAWVGVWFKTSRIFTS
jgi:hypothetical protein